MTENQGSGKTILETVEEYKHVLREAAMYYQWSEEAQRAYAIEWGRSAKKEMPRTGRWANVDATTVDLINEIIGHSEAEVKAAICCANDSKWLEWEYRVAYFEHELGQDDE